MFKKTHTLFFFFVREISCCQVFCKVLYSIVVCVGQKIQILELLAFRHFDHWTKFDENNKSSLFHISWRSVAKIPIHDACYSSQTVDYFRCGGKRTLLLVIELGLKLFQTDSIFCD